jgi:glycosyltransferase involved in cell wall biosynthesis
MPVRVIVPEGAEVQDYSADVEVLPLPVPMEFSLREVKRSPQRLAQLPRFLAALRGPQDHVLHFLNRHEYLTLAAPLVRRRLVVTLHDPRPHMGEASPRKLLANWMLRRQARGIIVLGEVLKQHLVEQGVPAQKVHVVPHGVFCPPETAAQPPREPTGLFFGRILPYKGLEVLLQAAPLIRERVPGFRLVIAGEGDVRPYQDLLDHEIKGGACQLHNRYIPDQEMGDLLAGSSVVLLPYLEATQSGVVPLAYGAGRPVIATSVGAIPEVVRHGETGLLVPPRDPVALAEAAAELLCNPALARKIGTAGYEYASQNLSWPAVAAQTANVYKRLAAG